MSLLQEVLLKAGVALAYAILEYWLGKNKDVQANSVLELILNYLKKLFKKT